MALRKITKSNKMVRRSVEKIPRQRDRRNAEKLGYRDSIGFGKI